MLLEVDEDDDAPAVGDEKSYGHMDTVLRAAKGVRVQYCDPSDPTTYIRIKNDNGVVELFEEWEAHSAEQKRRGEAVGKLRLYVTAILTNRGERRATSSETNGTSGGSPKTTTTADQGSQEGFVAGAVAGARGDAPGVGPGAEGGGGARAGGGDRVAGGGAGVGGAGRAGTDNKGNA